MKLNELNLAASAIFVFLTESPCQAQFTWTTNSDNTTISLNFGSSFGIQSNQFGFIISWATNVPVVVEACTNLSNAAWSPIATNTLVNGSVYFADPQWSNYPARFYRIRSP